MVEGIQCVGLQQTYPPPPPVHRKATERIHEQLKLRCGGSYRIIAMPVGGGP